MPLPAYNGDIHKAGVFMVDFRPFRGVRYTESAGNLADLICPPYDVISESLERQLLALSPHNMVRLELAELSGPPPADRYERAASEFARMKREGVLKQDDAASYYLLRQRFSIGGVQQERLGLLGALQVEELGGAVLPHEDTAAGPKKDRLLLMEATSANFSPIMMLFRDADHRVAQVTERVVSTSPYADFVLEGQGYTIWVISDLEDVQIVHDALRSQPTYIADGHHRYETAVGYGKRVGGGAGAVLTCLISFDDPGLVIQPYYRVVHGLDNQKLEQMRNLLATLFMAIPAVDLTPTGLDAAIANLAQNQVVLGVVEQGKAPVLLAPADDTVPAPDATLTPLEQAKAVEANVLQELLFRPVMGDTFPDNVAYVHDPVEAVRMVESGEAQIAFFIKGVPADVFEVVVGAGIRLPRKSTYFHPKLPSGLVINALD
jgi:uncharacterized protein (DUF1015 family)